MNLLHDTMIEMGINSNMLKMFSSTGAVIDPRKQLYSIGIKVERDSKDKKSDDWKQAYFEILDTMLDPRQLPPFKLGEVGAVYLWINGIGVDH